MIMVMEINITNNIRTEIKWVILIWSTVGVMNGMEKITK